MAERLTEYHFMAANIVRRLVDGSYHGRYEDDAAEWFDEAAYAGYYLWVHLTTYDMPGADMGDALEGVVMVTDPTGMDHEFHVVTDRWGEYHIDVAV